MGRRHVSRRDSMLFLLVVMALAVTGCSPGTLVVGLEPTPTATPLPTPVVHDYVNDSYGFTFRYPETWTLREKLHLVTLSRGTLVLNIAHGWASNPGFSPMGGRTGMPAGDFIYGDKVFFLDQVIPARVVEYERKDKMVLYGETSLVDADDLVFSIWLEDVVGTSYSELDIPKDVQAEAKEILESFERIETTGTPAVSTPAPAPSVEAGPAPTVEEDKVIYANDDYQLALICPASWEIEEVLVGQGVPGDASANAIHLTKESLRLAIQFKRVEEATELGTSGRPAGEIEERGVVTILGRETPKQVLMHEGKVKSVFLGDRFDDLELYAQLDGGVGAGTAYAAVDIPQSAQSEMEAILKTLHRTGELKSFGPETLTYENPSYGFSFQYPASWTVQEVAGEAVGDDAKLADGVTIRQGKFAIVVQYQLKSDPAQVGWGGSLVPGGLGYGEATLGDRVTLLGEDTYEHVWTYNGAVKAIAVNTTGEKADLVLSITMGDTSVRAIQDPEAATIPDSAIAALDQVVSTFTVGQ